MTTASDLLRAAIEASGLSARRFAVVVMSRDERTIRRWLAGDTFPPEPRAFVAGLMLLPERKRRLLIRLLTDARERTEA